MGFDFLFWHLINSKEVSVKVIETVRNNYFGSQARNNTFHHSRSTFYKAAFQSNYLTRISDEIPLPGIFRKCSSQAYADSFIGNHIVTYKI